MPKTVTFDFEVEGSPAQFAARLRAQVARESLKGWVGGSSFSLSPAPKPFRGKLRPTATGRFEVVGPGRTRVVGTCGSSGFAVWYFRVAVIVMPIFLGWAAWSTAAEVGLRVLPVIAFAILLLTILFVGIGSNVWMSDAQVLPLVEAIRRASGVTERRGEATRQTE